MSKFTLYIGLFYTKYNKNDLMWTTYTISCHISTLMVSLESTKVCGFLCYIWFQLGSPNDIATAMILLESPTYDDTLSL